MNKALYKSPWMDIIAKAGKVIEINIEGIIGGSFWEDEGDDGAINTKEAMRKELKAIADSDAETIIVNINSYGGDVNHGVSIYEMLAQHKAKVTTRVTGLTASIATVIAMAGDTKEISSNALFLVHKPMLMLMGQFNENEVDTVKQDLTKVTSVINNIYLKAGVKADDVTSLMEENNGSGKWLDADEVVSYGFADSIFEPLKMAAIHDPSIVNKLGITEVPKNHIMNTEQQTEMKGMFADLKSFLTNLLKPSKDGDESTAEAKAFEEKFNALQAQFDAATADATKVEELQAQLTEATAAKETAETEKATAATKVTDLEAKVTLLTAKLTKLGASSTFIEAPEGMEDDDEMNSDPVKKSLSADLKKLRGELTQVHA